MKKILLLALLIASAFTTFAMHITGGEMFYTLTSQSNGNFTYHVTLKLYRDCAATTRLDQTAGISVFDNASFASVFTNSSVPLLNSVTQHLVSPSPCIQNPPDVCYEVGFYEFDVTLPGTPAGYTIAYQRCCRIGSINNLIQSSTQGTTITAKIPGFSTLASAPANNSARFVGVDTVIVCGKENISYNFGATDADEDVLHYYFCNAYTGGGQGSTGNGPNSASPNPPSAPPYTSVSYNSPAFDAGFPLGPDVTVNPNTGLVSGIAPVAGIYVVTVCVDEIRNGVVIATQRKDLQIKIGDCNSELAKLKPSYITCDGFTFTFANEAQPSSTIHTYFWQFSDGFTSTDPSPVHTFADSGIYTFKLVINKGEECSDSATSQIKVYPGFFPGFISAGICVNNPTQFTDTSKSRYGLVNAWRWNFGDAATLADTSHLQNPAYTYTTTGTKNVEFIVSNSKGCTDTVQGTVNIIDKPPLSVAFADTLICRGDTVQLHAIGQGSFNWSPANNILNANTADPLVFPLSSQLYTVTLNQQGCIATATVNIRNVSFVTLQAMPDTSICAGDSLQLRATTDGLRFLWDNASTLNDATLLMPTAKPVQLTTVYHITATVGHCSATNDVAITMVPYPAANAGNDTTICFATPAQLNGSIVGTTFNWSPTTSLSGANTLTPVATPRRTTAYVLSAFDTRGCPKPGKDTVLVTVNPQVIAFAGRDTAVITGQPLQLNGTGGVTYAWSPATALNNPFIFNPKGIYDGSVDSVRYTLIVKDSIGCSDTATVLVKVFRTDPRIFVPTGFTPNGDGRNDFVAPVAVGISKINYFRVFNRWGQLVFETTVNGKGWDGKLAGKEQGSGTFVWIVQGTDYTGKVVFAKGTVTLIR